MAAREDFEKMLAPGIPAGRKKRMEADAEEEMAGLPKRQQAVLRYIYIHGFTPEGTAEALGISTASVQKAVSQAFSAINRARAKATKKAQT